MNMESDSYSKRAVDRMTAKHISIGLPALANNHGNPDRLSSPTMFKPQAVELSSCTVVRRISRLYLPSKAPGQARCLCVSLTHRSPAARQGLCTHITQVLSHMTRSPDWCHSMDKTYLG